MVHLRTLKSVVLGVVIIAVVGVGGFMLAKAQGWLTAWGVGSSSHDSAVVRAIERTQEVSLLSLGIQGIKEEHRSTEIFGQTVPGSGKAVFLQYNFSAKLGIDGAEVKVARSGDHTFAISVPEFVFIGYKEPTFKVAAEDGGVLSWTAPDIDRVAAVNDILNDEKQKDYITSNEELLRDQTKVFYTGLISSIDPEAVVSFEFQ